MTSLASLIPLFIAAGLLLAGNGVLGTVIALRASLEGFSPTFIGIMSAGYFAGFLMGCIRAPYLIEMVGHIRVFAALASLLAATSLMFNIAIDPYSWVVLRTIQGFCFCGVFTVVESWLNENAKNADRGRILGTYRMVDMLVVSGSQFIVPVLGVVDFVIFSVMGILFSLSLVPVSLSNRARPTAPVKFAFDLPAVWRLSPLACMSCIAVGLTNASFRTIGPLYGQAVGFDAAGIAAFMGAGIIGGGSLQIPLGYLSDRIGRRPVILLCSGGAALAGTFITLFAGDNASLIYAGSFLFGAFALPLYSLSAAHANDMAPKGGFVLVAAGITFFYGIGAIVGPLISSILIDLFGGPALFIYTSTIHVLLIVFALVRIRLRPRVPKSRDTGYVPLLRTSPVFHRLARRRNGTGAAPGGANTEKSAD